MKNTFKSLAALLAAATVISASSLSVSAATLKTENGIKYVQSDSGETKVYTGWTKKAGKRYYYKNGVMRKSCWLKSGGERTYYLKKDGSMAVGKVTISGIEYEFGADGKLIPDTWGLTLTAKNVTAGGMKLEILWDGTEPNEEAPSDGELEYGNHFYLEQYKNGKWVAVPYKEGTGDIAFTDEAYILMENVVAEKTIKWDYIYGELKSGKYRYCTQFMNYIEPGNFDRKLCYVYFKI